MVLTEKGLKEGFKGMMGGGPALCAEDAEGKAFPEL
jgi:hypothetical protein